MGLFSSPSSKSSSTSTSSSETKQSSRPTYEGAFAQFPELSAQAGLNAYNYSGAGAGSEGFTPFQQQLYGQATGYYDRGLQRGDHMFNAATADLNRARREIDAPAYEAQYARGNLADSLAMGLGSPVGTIDFSTAEGQSRMSPYMDLVLNTVMRDIGKRSDESRRSDSARLASARAYGGSRQAVMDAERGKNTAQLQADTQIKGKQAAFEAAQGAFMQDKAREMQGKLAGQQTLFGLMGQDLQREMANAQAGNRASEFNIGNYLGQEQRNIQNALTTSGALAGMAGARSGYDQNLINFGAALDPSMRNYSWGNAQNLAGLANQFRGQESSGTQNSTNTSSSTQKGGGASVLGQVAGIASIASGIGKNQTWFASGGVLPEDEEDAFAAWDELEDRGERGGGEIPYEALIGNIIRTESGGRADAVSPKGATGLMQIMPETGAQIARELGVKDFSPEMLKNPELNRKFGEYYTRKLLDQFGGNQTLALAGYNAGPGRVSKWIERFGDPRSGEVSEGDWTAKIPFKETREYVQKVLAGGGASSGSERAPQVAQAPQAQPRQTPQEAPQRAQESERLADQYQRLGLPRERLDALMGDLTPRATKRYGLFEEGEGGNPLINAGLAMLSGEGSALQALGRGAAGLAQTQTRNNQYARQEEAARQRAALSQLSAAGRLSIADARNLSDLMKTDAGNRLTGRGLDQTLDIARMQERGRGERLADQLTQSPTQIRVLQEAGIPRERWSEFLKPAPLVQTTNKQESAYAGAQGASYAKKYDQIADTAGEEQKKLDILNGASNLLAGIQTGGPVTGLRTSIGKFLAGADLPTAGLTGLSTEEIGRLESAKSLMGNLTLTSIKALGANPSEGDRKFMEQINPSLATTPEGLQTMIEVQKRIAQRAQDIEDMKHDYVVKNGQLDSGFDRSVREQFKGKQMFDGLSIPKTTAGSPPTQPRQPAKPGGSEKIQNTQSAAPNAPKPGDVRSGWRYNGGDPADKNSWERM